MDLYYKQEISVGVLIIVGIATFFLGLSWLTGQSLRRGRIEVPVQFASVSGLSEGDPVQLSGVQVGRVGAVELEDIGRVLVRLEVQERVRPKVDARAAIQSLDFLGAKFVDYNPGTSARLLEAGQSITGVSGSDIAETAETLTDRAVEVMIGIQRLLTQQMADDLRETLQAAQRAMLVVERLAESPVTTSAQGALQALERSANRLDSTLANPAINESISQLDEITENVTEMTEGLSGATASLSAMLAQMRDTSGTVGKLLTGSTIHDDVHEVLLSLKRLLDDIRARPGRYTNVSVF